MNSKDALIDKILSDAKAKRDENIADANERKNKIDESIEQIISTERSANDEFMTGHIKEIIDRKITVAKIDCSKLNLKAKREILDEIFSKAVEQIKKSGKYSNFIEKLILDNAENGDEVIVSKDDEKIVTSEFVSSIAQKCNKKITLSKEKGNFLGGVVLSQGGCDKNLTLEVVMRELRGQIEPEISKDLFEVDYAK